jgi:bacterioferritin (cytochrome b1)
MATLFKRTAIVEMGHVEMPAERILFLQRDVAMAASAPVESVADPAGMLAKTIEISNWTTSALRFHLSGAAIL